MSGVEPPTSTLPKQKQQLSLIRLVNLDAFEGKGATVKFRLIYQHFLRRNWV